jgi:negative regulator of sigma E activity
MNDALKMQISAFVDGELPENESELLLRRLSQDSSLRERVALYLNIGRLIRRDPEVPGADALRDRIWAALGEEPVEHVAVSGASASRFTRPAVGLAIAASVAFMALFTLRQVYAPKETPEPAEELVVVPVPPSQSGVDPASDALLEQFYLYHDPRLVTWQLQDGVLIEIDTDDKPAEADETETEGQD